MFSSVIGASALATVARTASLAGASTAGQIDPTALAEAPIAFRVAGAFVLVLLFGGIFLVRSSGFVERAVDATMEKPLHGVVYGVLAQGGLVFLGAYGYSQLVQFGPVGAVVGAVGLWVVIITALALSALGLAVVGTAVTDVAGGRQQWPGLVIGATVGAAAWLVPSISLALLGWVLVVSVGVGGPTRVWFHDSAGRDPR